MYKDNFVSEGLVSNRSFAPVAFMFSFVLSSYAVWRAERIEVPCRVIAWPIIVFLGYLGFGLALILLNGWVGQLAKH